VTIATKMRIPATNIVAGIIHARPPITNPPIQARPALDLASVAKAHKVVGDAKIYISHKLAVVAALGG
jgi:hypothetical protein